MLSMLSRDSRIDRALNSVHASATDVASLELDHGRLVIFSDQHRGVRNGEDDFARCEPAYAAALDFYFAQNHTLIVLGDAEELWEESPAAVMRAHERTLRSEARFHAQNRYIRVAGNHDDAWQSSGAVARHLEPLFGRVLPVHQALRIPVMDRGRQLGEIFLTHGHQGTGDSDRFAALSRLIVRFVWRPLQRLTGYSFNTPSKDFSLRERHDETMYGWAASRTRTVLIVGHTHRPVFKSQKHAAQLRAEIARLEGLLKKRGQDSELLQQMNDLRLRLEQVLAQDGAPEAPDNSADALNKPCYFNSGCCCYPDGDITGIEIARGEIRLVRWSSMPEKPVKVLAYAPLAGVFEALN